MFKGAIWSPDGHTDGLYMFGTTVNACCMLTVNLKCGFMTRTFTKWNVLALLYSVVVWFCFVIFYAEMDFVSHRFFGLGEELYGNVAFWLSLPLVPFIACMPDMVVQYIQVRPSVSLATSHIYSLCTEHCRVLSQFNYFERPWDKVRKNCKAGVKEQISMDHPTVTAQGNLPDHKSFSYDHATLDHPECKSSTLELAVRPRAVP
jgi:hypothetical protein